MGVVCGGACAQSARGPHMPDRCLAGTRRPGKAGGGQGGGPGGGNRPSTVPCDRGRRGMGRGRARTRDAGEGTRREKARQPLSTMRWSAFDRSCDSAGTTCTTASSCSAGTLRHMLAAVAAAVRCVLMSKKSM